MITEAELDEAERLFEQMTNARAARAVRTATCRLRLYETEMFDDAALLELRLPQGPAVLLDFRGPTTRTRRHPPSAPKSELPKSVPAALVEVHALCGGIRMQFGASGSLIAPDALHPWPAAWNAEMGIAGPGPFEETLQGGPLESSPERAHAMVVFYEDSGSFACFEADGRATWVSSSGDALPMGTVDDALEMFFQALIEGTIPSLYPQSFVAGLVEAALPSTRKRPRRSRHDT